MGAFVSLIAGLATGETLSGVRRARRALVAYLIAGTLALFGALYLLIGGTIWVARRYGCIEATLTIGGVFIVLALIVVVIHKMSSGVRVKTAARQRNRDLTNAAIAAGIAAAPALLRGRVGLAALLVPAISVIAYAIYRENRDSDPSDPPEAL